MPLSDVLVAALSRPAGRVVDTPVRAIVAEILASHGYASPAEVGALREELAALRGKIQTLGGRLDALEAGLSAARAESEQLRAALERANEQASQPAVATEPPAPVVATEPPAPVVATAPPAPVVATEPPAEIPTAEGCKVSGCGSAAFAQGFCRAHHHQWRSGHLAGFVSPEGLLDLDGKAGRVSLDLAGQPYKISDKDGRLRVAGRFASAALLG